MNKMTDQEIGWIAGLIEGEGCIWVVSNRKCSPAIQIAMIDFDIVTRIHEVTGVGNLTIRKPPTSNRQVQLRWLVSKKDDVEEVLLSVYDLLGDRRKARTDEVLESIRQSRIPLPIPHGTPSGYETHKRRGENPCEECVVAHKTYNREGARRRKKEKLALSFPII